MRRRILGVATLLPLVFLCVLTSPGVGASTVDRAPGSLSLSAPPIAAYPGLPGGLYVALGDSISAGRYARTAAATFPYRVAARLDMRLRLVAKSGALTSWALPRLNAIRRQHPRLVTIELGTNDVGYHTPLRTFASEYRAVVSALSQPGTSVVCIGSWLPAAAQDRIIQTACEKDGGTFVSLSGFYQTGGYHAHAGRATYLGTADWFHPGDLGHLAIADAVASALSGLGLAPATPRWLPGHLLA